MLSELQLKAYHDISLWRDPETGKIKYTVPSGMLNVLQGEVAERIHMIFSRSDLALKLPRGATMRYGACDQCGGEIDGHRAGTCLLCVVAYNKAASLEPDKRYVFLDTETTSKNPQKCGIIELALVITDTTGKTLDQFHTRVKLEPERHYYLVEYEALAINHYSKERWRDAITLEECIDEVVKRIRPQDVMIAWNVGYDASAIASNARLVCNTEWRQEQRRFDAMSLAAPLKSRGVVASKKLIEVARALGVEHSEAHAALADTIACRDVFFYLMANPHVGSPVSTDVRVAAPETDSGPQGLGAELRQDGHQGQENGQAPSAERGTQRSCGCDGHPCPPWHPR